MSASPPDVPTSTDTVTAVGARAIPELKGSAAASPSAAGHNAPASRRQAARRPVAAARQQVPGQVRNVDALPARGIFLSYRRQDTGPYAWLLKIQLGGRFPGTPVFMDLDSIEPGTDFAEAIESALGSCTVLVALIGSQWLTVADGDGRRRIADPDDYVRFEIQTALERGVRVIPVLVDGAVMPRAQQLPGGLARLARLSALEMSYRRFEDDEARLTAAMRKLLQVPTPSARS